MAPQGYAWWYLDALSDDGQHALVVIAFIGSVFSPNYYRARRAGADACDFCAMNVALYSAHSRRWVFSEYRREALRRNAGAISIGANLLRWSGAALECRIDERAVPLPRRLRGQIALTGALVAAAPLALTANGRHRWQPLVPQARVVVELDCPRLHWQGCGYFDSNEGDGPLEEDVRQWTWLRAHGGGGTRVLYDIYPSRGPALLHALHFPLQGAVQPITAPPVAALPPSGWGIARPLRLERGSGVDLIATLEDTPFYARSLLRANLGGERVNVLHESLSLQRFQSPWVRALLPFRMRTRR